jgi:hypothetical protein
VSDELLDVPFGARGRVAELAGVDRGDPVVVAADGVGVAADEVPG